MTVPLPQSPEAGGKFYFVENNIPLVRNFTYVVLHSPDGYRTPVQADWVELVTGSGEDRALDVGLSSTEVAKLARAHLRKKRNWHHDVKLIAVSIIVGWIIRSAWMAL